MPELLPAIIEYSPLQLQRHGLHDPHGQFGHANIATDVFVNALFLKFLFIIIPLSVTRLSTAYAYISPNGIYQTIGYSPSNSASIAPTIVRTL